MFSSLLVANRGEIACRIFRTARAMGLRCIAVYSEADARAKHVREADEAHLIGPPPAAQSYLDIGAILEAAGASGAAAIHPGYGFLSENPDFAEAVIRAGLIWVGPTPASIRAMGLKDEAKRIAEEAGAPVVPGYRGADQNERVLAEAAHEIGFPVLIKAIAGGGGRGIREVRTADEFSGALASAQREARAAFGDDRVLIEKLIQRPRHIEVQVFGDKHGGLVHLYERDCSLQRRRQKVIEEAPAPGMTDAVRAVMTEAALKIARAVNYENAGTVEFIVEGAPRVDNFYFMEMNTRLQVEHPVTEAITGLDLVEWQLRVAAGEALPLAQDQITMNGHAIEARICAEDPAQDFRPSVGRLNHCAWPSYARQDQRGDRGSPYWTFLDTGFDQGDGVPPDYDSLVAKVCAHSRNPDVEDHREDASAILRAALSSIEVLGVQTNAGFLHRCVEDEGFRKGDIDTGLIERRLEKLTSKARLRSVAALLAAITESKRATVGPWARDGWRANQKPRSGWRFAENLGVVDVEFSIDGETGEAVIGGQAESIRRYWRRGDRRHAVRLDDGIYSAHRIEMRAGVTCVFIDGEAFEFSPPGAHFDLDEAAASDSILAPLPGKIAAINIAPGASVKRGDVLAVLEAMKMEHALAAPRDGEVAEVAVAAGAQVRQRDLIVKLAPL